MTIPGACVYLNSELSTRESYEGLALSSAIMTTSGAAFDSFGLDDRLLRAIAKLGWSKPTLIQGKRPGVIIV